MATPAKNKKTNAPIAATKPDLKLLTPSLAPRTCCSVGQTVRDVYGSAEPSTLEVAIAALKVKFMYYSKIRYSIVYFI